MPSALRLQLAILLLVWIAGGLYCWQFLDQGWVPYDEGGIGISALKASQGLIPHRDFQEIYTGGSSYLHGLAMKVFGVRLTSPRRALFLVFLLWLPAVFYIATRFSSAWMAGLMTLLAVTWSLPNYPAAVPSWYNLFWGTLGTAALLRHLETEHRRWLVAAGVFGGLSCLAKTTGLFFLAGTGLAFLTWEPTKSHHERRATEVSKEASSLCYSTVKIVGLVLLVALLFWLNRWHGGIGGVFHFVLPTATLVVWMLLAEGSASRRSSRARFSTLWHLVAPFGLGVGVVGGLFLLPYCLSGALPELLRSLALGVQNRVRFAAQYPPAFSTVITSLPVVALLGYSHRWRPRTQVLIAAALLIPLAAAIVLSSRPFIYSMIFLSFRSIVPLTVLAGAALLWTKARQGARDRPMEQKVLTVLSVVALSALVQYPYAAPIYFFYVGSLGALALLAVVRYQQPGPRPVFAVLVVFYAVFSVLWINPGFIYWMGIKFVPNSQTHVLSIDRGGLRVTASDKRKYESVVALVREHAKGGYVFATPDCPEIYFLTGLESPTGTIFEFLESSHDRLARTRAALDAKDVRVVVLNLRPEFSGRPPVALLEKIRRQFPSSRTIDNFEEVGS